jgi:pyridoxal 5'-phosphate synthase pdxS subunit
MAKKIVSRKEKKGTDQIKQGFAKMVKHGVIMDVTTAEQAKIAEKAGAVAVMALERVPSDIRAQGGVARMADPQKVSEIINAVTIPVMGKARIGHPVEAQILESLGVDMVDESEVLTPADEEHHIDKSKFTVPFVCGARDLGEALRRINEGAAMIRTKGEAGTGNVVEAVRHMNKINSGIAELKELLKKGDKDALARKAHQYRVPVELVEKTAKLGRLTVVNFAAGGIATPADAALMMQMGADGVFVGSGIFKSKTPAKMAKAIVESVLHYNDPKVLAKVSTGLGDPMKGLDVRSMEEKHKLAGRGI